MIGVPILIGMFVAKHFGLSTGIVAGLVSAIVSIPAVCFYYHLQGRKRARRRLEFRQKYTRIYCVRGLPDQGVTKVAQGAKIKIGDYGWEAEPLRNDGLIYLQGINPQWRIVWYAGFRPEQIEEVATKSHSQYDWNYAWVHNPPSCPYPVHDYHPTVNMGFPV